MTRQPRAVSRRRRRAFVTWLLALAGSSAGCGNYSNEDLEYLNAIPLRQDMAVEVPRPASLVIAGTAQGWQRMWQVTNGMNQTADGFLSLIDKIRTFYPNGRDGNTRVWGPFPSDENPGWRFEFRMLKPDSVAPHFDYELILIPPPGTVLSLGGATTTIIAGSFDATGGVRVGTGQLRVTLDEARAAGVGFPGLEKLRSLTIDYANRAWPRTVTIAFVNLAPPSPPGNDATSGTYAYTRQENGDGTMSFSWVADFVPGAAGDDTLQIQTRWLGTGPGREDLSVIAGDGVGATAVECWDQTFSSSYESQSWDPGSATGDESTCVPRR